MLLYLLFRQNFQCFGQYFPFTFHHHSFLKSFGSVIFQNKNRFLKNNFSAVTNFIYKMNSGSCNLNTVFKCGFMNLETIKSVSAKGRNQRWMNIYNPVAVMLNKIFT